MTTAITPSLSWVSYQGRGPVLDESEEPRNQLPAIIQQAEIASNPRALNVVPALIADLGDEAAWRYVEFFTANIRNPHTRRAYARACSPVLRLVRGPRPDARRDPAA